MSRYSTQIVIFGGGICGLWLLNLLRSRGYDAWLLEKTALGGEQTLASQGMIHGGLKYSLGGFATPSSETIANMPHVWRSCLLGKGPVDLSGLDILSDDYYLFSDGALSSKVTAYFASKSIKSRISALSRDHYPSIFQQSQFKGLVYRLQDLVLDTPSLLRKLVAGNEKYIFKSAPAIVASSGRVSNLKLPDGTEVVADKYIFAAGAGNQKLLAETSLSSVKMQLRPLQQVMAKGQLPAIYAHAVSLKSMNKPRLTITSHPADDGEMIWYLGGNLAETGAGKSAEEVIRQAQKEIGELLPWIDISQVAWASFNIDRAEPAQASMTRPDSPFVEAKDNCIVCWPTKLTLAPMLGDIVLNELNLEANAIPGTTPDLRPAPYAQTPWEIAFAG